MDIAENKRILSPDVVINESILKVFCDYSFVCHISQNISK